jgi:hypothetical protein
MLILLAGVLLAGVGAKSKPARCSGLTKNGQVETWLRVSWDGAPTVRIVEAASAWAEARVIPRLAGLLLHDLLGYEVEFVEAPGGMRQMYQYLQEGVGDVCFVLWPANYEAPGLARAVAVAATNDRSATGLSPHGPRSARADPMRSVHSAHRCRCTACVLQVSPYTTSACSATRPAPAGTCPPSRSSSHLRRRCRRRWRSTFQLCRASSCKRMTCPC